MQETKQLSQAAASNLYPRVLLEVADRNEAGAGVEARPDFFLLVVIPVLATAIAGVVAWWLASNAPRINARGIWEHSENWTYFYQNDSVMNVCSLAWLGVFLAGLILWRKDFLVVCRFLCVIKSWRKLAKRLGVSARVINKYAEIPESKPIRKGPQLERRVTKGAQR